jgi:ligand-binding sensor domain-containing protein/serine phosphatase RsbU (regulator of sigma subunit)
VGLPLALRRAELLAVAIAAWCRPASALDPSKSPSQYVAHGWRQSDDGLPQNFVGALAQTRDGYIWIATQEGLVRFDGERFTVMTTREVPELQSNDLHALLVDHKGALWIGTRGGGLSRYADGAWRSYRQADGLPSDFVLALHETKDGAIWIGTRGGGAARLKDGVFTTFTTKQGLAHDVVMAIAELPDGSVFLGTEAGLSRFRDGSFTTTRDELSAPTVQALLADPDGTLWVGTDGGVDRLQEGAVAALWKAGGPAQAAHALLRDRDGSLWIGEQAGIHRLAIAPNAAGVTTPLGILAPLEGDEAFRYDLINAFLEDTEGNVWVGSNARGLFRLQDGKVTTFGTGVIWTIVEDAQGSLWLGGSDGLYTIRGDSLALLPDPTRLSTTNIWSLAKSGDGGLFLGTEARGAVLCRDGRCGHVDSDARLGAGAARAVFHDSHGVTWIGLNDGVARVVGDDVKFLGVAEGVPHGPTNSITEGPDGRVWVAHDRGVLEWKGSGFVLHDPRDEGSTVGIMAIAFDGEDIWAGTFGGGVELLHDGDLVGRVTSKEGLFNDVAYAVADDGRGELWMTCNKGIFHAKKSDLVAVATGQRRELTSAPLGTADGMRSSECNSGSPGAIRARDGRLWFPTAAGAVRVDPAHMRRNDVVPPVRIEEVQVDRAPIDGLRSTEAATAKTELPAGSKDFAFRYTALSFTAPERVRFKYMLEGFDRDWVDAGPRRVAYYTNLSPGKYRFRVVAANDDGVWNAKGAETSFVLLPRFYQTIPFYLACALGLMLVGAGSVRLRVVQLRHRAEMLERKVDERTVQLAKANDDLQGAFKALAEKDARLHEDLLQAQAFQQRILPRLPASGPLRIRALYKPADLVGGDIYDVWQMPDGRTRVFMADTTGHGVQASLRTMVLKTEWERLKGTDHGPGQVLSELNEKISTVYPGLEMRCSALCFDVVPLAGGGASVRYANAAHPPLLRASGGKVEEIYASGTFLGMIGGVTFRETSVRLDEGDLLLAYTDGICEQEDAAGQAFGIERMQEILSAEPHADGALATLDRAMAAFAGGRALDDDVALVCIECAAQRMSREVAE